MREIRNSKNVVAAPIDANGNVVVGDGNNVTVFNLKEAAQYKVLEAEIHELNDDINKTNAKIENYPDDNDFKADLFRIKKKRKQKQEELETLRNEVLKLAAEFERIPINTERLRLAKLHFDKGEFKEARAVLNSEVMHTELNALLNEEMNLKQKSTENKQKLVDRANEYHILAYLTAIDFDLPYRLQKTKGHFEDALRANRSVEILAGYAYFLKAHNQYGQVQSLYEEILSIYRELAEDDSEKYQAHIAGYLNNLGRLYRSQKLFESSKKYLKEALEIRRSLNIEEPNSHLPDLATTLDNLANLYQDLNHIDKSRQLFDEALIIRSNLANSDPDKYLYDFTMTLNNVALLNWKAGDIRKAQLFINRAFDNIIQLEKKEPKRYLSDKALMYNNMGGLALDLGEFGIAERRFIESLDIRRKLAKVSQETYLLDVAKTALHLASLYKNNIPSKSKSLSYCREAIKSATPFGEQRYLAKQIISEVNLIAEGWGESLVGF